LFIWRVNQCCHSLIIFLQAPNEISSSILDQIPFAVTLSQVGDINQGDQSFIQNRAVSFSIDVHDPSQYLSGSDISFNWDFGDNSGTLISREATVTHTYLSTGSFRPQVVLMAAISNGCQINPTPAATVVPPVSVTGRISYANFIFHVISRTVLNPKRDFRMTIPKYSSVTAFFFFAR